MADPRSPFEDVGEAMHGQSTAAQSAQILGALGAALPPPFGLLVPAAGMAAGAGVSAVGRKRKKKVEAAAPIEPKIVKRERKKLEHLQAKAAVQEQKVALKAAQVEEKRARPKRPVSQTPLKAKAPLAPQPGRVKLDLQGKQPGTPASDIPRRAYDARDVAVGNDKLPELQAAARAQRQQATEAQAPGNPFSGSQFAPIMDSAPPPAPAPTAAPPMPPAAPMQAAPPPIEPAPARDRFSTKAPPEPTSGNPFNMDPIIGGLLGFGGGAPALMAWDQGRQQQRQQAGMAQARKGLMGVMQHAQETGQNPQKAMMQYLNTEEGQALLASDDFDNQMKNLNDMMTGGPEKAPPFVKTDEGIIERDPGTGAWNKVFELEGGGGGSEDWVVEQVGNHLLRVNKATGETQPLFEAPNTGGGEAPAEIKMMQAMGLDPRNPEHQAQFASYERSKSFGPQPTSDIQVLEYVAKQNGLDLQNPEEFKKATALAAQLNQQNVSNINYPTGFAPTGEVTPQGIPAVQPMPGTPEAEKRQSVAEANKLAEETLTQMEQAIDKSPEEFGMLGSLKEAGRKAAGAAEQLTGAIPYVGPGMAKLAEGAKEGLAPAEGATTLPELRAQATVISQSLARQGLGDEEQRAAQAQVDRIFEVLNSANPDLEAAKRSIRALKELMYGKKGGSTVLGRHSSQGAPSVGTVEEGYRFKGGDPADPQSWEKVQ